MIPLRLVIDTNIVVSAALKPEGLQRSSSPAAHCLTRFSGISTISNLKSRRQDRRRYSDFAIRLLPSPGDHVLAFCQRRGIEVMDDVEVFGRLLRR